MIKLRQVIINNFKSLNQFNLEFSEFTCLIGLNNSGKSTILQAIDFISQQMHGNISDWLEDRKWEAKELGNKLIKQKNITIAISFKYNDVFFTWAFGFNPVLKKCTTEYIQKYDENKENPETIFEVKDSKYFIQKDNKNQEVLQGDIIQDYEGSFLSSLKPELLPNVLVEFKTFIKNIYSLDLLSPQELRKRSRTGSKLGLSGENLSAFLNTFTLEQKNKLLLQLKKCYKNLDSFSVRKSAGGWSRLELVEKFNGNKITNEAKYLNDGVLRIIAILAQIQSQKSFLLFDELENGINSELIEFLLDTLIDSKHQIMITTHSPMILNYIEDDIAIKSVHYVYKTKEGFTNTIPFFSIPSMKEKLEFMGSGEVYVDTNLTELHNEIEIIKKQETSE